MRTQIYTRIIIDHMDMIQHENIRPIRWKYYAFLLTLLKDLECAIFQSFIRKEYWPWGQGAVRVRCHGARCRSEPPSIKIHDIVEREVDRMGFAVLIQMSTMSS